LQHGQRRAAQGAGFILAASVFDQDAGTAEIKLSKPLRGTGGGRTIGDQTETLAQDPLGQTHIGPVHMVAIGNDTGADTMAIRDSRIIDGATTPGSRPLRVGVMAL